MVLVLVNYNSPAEIIWADLNRANSFHLFDSALIWCAFPIQRCTVTQFLTTKVQSSVVETLGIRVKSLFYISIFHIDIMPNRHTQMPTLRSLPTNVTD